MTTAAPETRPDTQQLPNPTADALDLLELFPVTLRLPETALTAGPDASEDWFWAVCMANNETTWQMELNAKGELELMPPTYPPSDEHEGESFGEVRQWNIGRGRPGTATGPTSAYRLANGAIRCPDAAWAPKEKVLPPSPDPPRARPYCPDFVVEIRSTSQRSLSHLLNKMQEYMDNGAKLGWLIDPIERTVRVYRAGVAEPELLHDPTTLDGEDVLPRFTFAVGELIFDLE
ncbi:MAG: Uma2 family endonuclease [Chloroflexota bacterium]|nr:Uma2 family endonuclease [Chloroflexota bacterium]MDE2960693.1 Uma2 family endonuclease [Chloroflexota bacterium]